MNDKLSTYQIAQRYGCYASTIYNKLIKHNIKLRDVVNGVILSNNRRFSKIAKSLLKYNRRSFNGSFEEGAYIIGFRLGDLHVRKNPHGETVFVQTCSTKKEQINLFRQIFSRYGCVNINKRNSNGFCMTANLDLSFKFLLDNKDEIKDYILKNHKYFINFLAGYIDAEGSFGIYNNHPEFTIATYQKNIIRQIASKLNYLGVSCRYPRITVKSGYKDKRGILTTNNLWRLRITKNKDLLTFILLVKPFIKHKKRKNDLINIEKFLLYKFSGKPYK